MDDPAADLQTADPETARRFFDSLKKANVGPEPARLARAVETIVWGLSQKTALGDTLAGGLAMLFASADPVAVDTYTEMVREAAADGPTLAAVYAEHLPPVLATRNEWFRNRFPETIDIMRRKGHHTLRRPTETLSRLLNSGETESAYAFIDLLYILYQKDMSYNLCLHLTHVIPKEILDISEEKRPVFIRELTRLIEADLTLPDAFFDGLQRGIKRLSEKGLRRFVDAGLENHRLSPGLGKSYLSADTQRARSALADFTTGAALASNRRRFQRYLRARCGRPVTVRSFSQMPGSLQDALQKPFPPSRARYEHTPAFHRFGSQAPDAASYGTEPTASRNRGNGTGDHPEVLTDGRTLYLPGEIDIFESRQENEERYQVLLKLEAGLIEFHTFLFDVNRLALNEWMPQTGPLPPAEFSRHAVSMETTDQRAGISREAAADRPVAAGAAQMPGTDLERFWAMFPNPALAADLFTVFEHGRHRLRFQKQYPGLWRRVFPILSQEMQRRLNCQAPAAPSGKIVNTAPLPGACGKPLLPLYAAVAVGLREETKDRPLLADIAQDFSARLSADSRVEAAAALTARRFFDISNYASKHAGKGGYRRMHLPFGREIRPDLFHSAFFEYEEKARRIQSMLASRRTAINKSDLMNAMIQKDGIITPTDIAHAIQHKNRLNVSRLPGEGENHVSPLSSLDLNSLFAPISSAAGAFEKTVEGAHRYKEWDAAIQDYRQDYVRVVERLAPEVENGFFEKTLSRRQGLVKRIKRAFEHLKPEGIALLRGWPEGDEFDYRALIHHMVDRKSGIMPTDLIYRKRIKDLRDIAVLLLVDLSRSTANPVEGGGGGKEESVLDLEKAAIVLFCEALTVVGDRFAVAGFSGTGRLGVDYYCIKDFEEPVGAAVRRRVNAVSPQRSTRMGAAVRHAAARLESVEAAARLMLIIGDGFPNDLDYKQQYAVEDTRKAVGEARAKHLRVKAITVNLPGDPRLDDLYGASHHVVISDIRELPDKLLRIYTSLTR